jgi:phosphoribosylglycinamide formyltransferase-1
MIILGVLASGRGSNLQAILDAQAAGLPAQVGVVISDVQDAMALERAREAGVPACLVDPGAFPGRAAYEGALARCLEEHGVDLVCLAGYMRVVGRVLLDAFPLRIMNIHPSLLPAFPGLDAQGQAVKHGVKVAGCTVHFVDKGVDTGPIIIQRAVPVLEGDDRESLARRILQEEHIAYPDAIRLYAEGRLVVEGRRVKVRPSQAGH